MEPCTYEKTTLAKAVAIATLKGEALPKRYVRPVGVQYHLLAKDQQDIETFLGELLEEEGFGEDNFEDCA